MQERSVLFSGNKEAYIVRILMKKLQDSGIESCFVPCTVNEIGAGWREGMPVVLWLDEDARPGEDVLHFLADTLEEKDGHLILIGDPSINGFVSDHIPGELIYRTFSRPVNNGEFIASLTDFFEKEDQGEFKKRILIVDDDTQYLALVREWLKETYKVSMANSGLQAIKFLGKNKVDLILLDHEMPVTSGPQVLEMLRSDVDTRDIPVMFLTGKSDRQSVMSVVALKPEGYFLKTIQKDELLEKLKEFFILRLAK